MLIFCCPIFALRINRHLFLKKEFQIPEVMSHLRASQVVLVVKNPPVNAVNAGDEGLIPGSGRSPGKGNGNPLQYSCLENPKDGGAWWAVVYGVAQSWT